MAGADSWRASGFATRSNAFTGVHASWEAFGGRLHAFYFRPHRRRPADRGALLDNQYESDSEAGGAAFWGGGIERGSDGGLTGFDVFGRRLGDGRRLITGSVRLERKTRAWRLRSQTALQTETAGIEHRAIFQHLSAMREIDERTDVTLAVDYASGDSPYDQVNRGFDTLFGVQRVDWSHGGLYSAFRRGNVLSPWLRIDRKTARGKWIAGYRPVWLANPRGAWAGISDPSASPDRFVGHHLDARWQGAWSDTWRLEVGGAYLIKGDRAKLGVTQDDTVFVYLQVLAAVALTDR